MIKLCKVLKFNKLSHIVVVLFDDIQVQFVTDKDIVGDAAYVKKDGNNYTICDESDYKKIIRNTKKQKREHSIEPISISTTTSKDIEN